MTRLMKLSNIWRLFPQAEVKESGETVRKRVVAIVRSLSNGNVSLRAGHYVTKSDLAEKRKRIVQHKYV